MAFGLTHDKQKQGKSIPGMAKLEGERSKKKLEGEKIMEMNWNIGVPFRSVMKKGEKKETKLDKVR